MVAMTLNQNNQVNGLAGISQKNFYFLISLIKILK